MLINYSSSVLNLMLNLQDVIDKEFKLKYFADFVNKDFL